MHIEKKRKVKKAEKVSVGECQPGELYKLSGGDIVIATSQGSNDSCTFVSVDHGGLYNISDEQVTPVDGKVVVYK